MSTYQKVSLPKTSTREPFSHVMFGLTFWQVDFLTSWLFGKLTFWQVDFLASSLCGKLTFWQVDFLEVGHFTLHPCWELWKQIEPHTLLVNVIGKARSLNSLTKFISTWSCKSFLGPLFLWAIISNLDFLQTRITHFEHFLWNSGL